jgi:thiol-disulfide isomerase/thioredoxin
MNIKSISFLAVITIIILAGCGDKTQSGDATGAATSNAPAEQPNPSPQKTMMPAFQVQDVKGNVTPLEQYKGKKVFVNFWASWCPPCKREMPSIEKLYADVDTSKVTFLLVSLDDEFGKAKKYVSSQNLKLPIYYPASNLPPLFNVEAIPATFIFNENGELLNQVNGSDNYEQEEYRQLLK